MAVHVFMCETIVEQTVHKGGAAYYWSGAVSRLLTTAMPTEQNSTFEEPTETTPIDVIHKLIESNMTSSSSRGAVFYFLCTGLVITIIGAAANALVLYAMVASKQHKKHVMIFNQNVLDLVNCIIFGVQYSVRLSNIYLDGTLGYWLCMLLLSDCFSWSTYIGSMINLAAISIDRYLNIVHHAWAKKNLRNWMTYSTIAFTWIGSIAISAAAIFPTSAVVNGVCFARWFFKSSVGQKAFGIWYFLTFYVIIISIWVFCYGRILVVIRRQARVMAAHSGRGSNTTQDQSNKIQTSVIKTMTLVCGLYAITWAPMFIYSLLKNLYSKSLIVENGVIAVMSIGYLYICINPFIYATKFDPVKHVLLGLIPWMKNNIESIEST